MGTASNCRGRQIVPLKIGQRQVEWLRISKNGCRSWDGAQMGGQKLGTM